MLFQLYLTGAVYSLDGSDSLKETMQTSIAAADKVTADFTGSPSDRMDHMIKCVFSFYWLTYNTPLMVIFPTRAWRRWTSEYSVLVSPPTSCRVKPRTGPSGWGWTWPTCCWAKEPRRSWRWPGSSTTPDNPAEAGWPGVTTAVCPLKTWNPLLGHTFKQLLRRKVTFRHSGPAQILRISNTTQAEVAIWLVWRCLSDLFGVSAVQSTIGLGSYTQYLTETSSEICRNSLTWSISQKKLHT